MPSAWRNGIASSRNSGRLLWIRHRRSPRASATTTSHPRERTRMDINVAEPVPVRSVHPARLALLEERREAIPRLGAGTDLGERARQPRAVFLPRRIPEQREQRLDAALRGRRRLEQLADALSD